jgi:hypothetical protein
MALDPQFGMDALSEELHSKVPGRITKDSTAKKQWEKVDEKLQNKVNLEDALNEVNNRFLKDTVIQITGDFMAGLDHKYKLKILNGEVDIPIEYFLQKLFNGLPEYDPVLDIITPNYDLLLEHCCDKLEIPYINGFWGGIRKNQNSEEAVQQMVYVKNITRGKKILEVKRVRKHIRLHKVHGSLNWFKFKKKGCFFEDNSLVYEILSDHILLERHIITPGDTKYQETFLKTIDFFVNATQAIAEGQAFVFVGYGFNDDHIQKKIENKLVENKKAGIIITKVLSRKADNLLKKSDKLWAVYQNKEGDDNKNEYNTQIYNYQYKKPLVIENSSIWDIRYFSREVLGD